MSAETDQPRLYFAPGSSSLAPHVALLEAGADFEAIPVMLAAGEQRRPEFLSVNPKGRIPALVVGDSQITEVIGLLTWIAHRYPEADLLPLGDPTALAAAYSKMSVFATDLHVAMAQFSRTERFTPDERLWPALKEAGLNNLGRGFADIEQNLSGRWIMGDRYSVLDAYALVLWRWAERLGFDLAAYPKWREHSERMFKRPAVAKAAEAEKEAAARAG